MAKQKVIVSIMADASKFQRTMSNLARVTGISGLQRFGAALLRVGAAAGVAGIAIGTKLVSAAANLEQSIGGVDAIFKQNAGTIHAWAQQANTSVGLTRNSYNELATLIGAQLKNAGTAMDDLAPKTDNLIRLGADMAATFGGTTADAVAAISSALKNERDPIEKYGVALNQAAVDAKAAELGFSKVNGVLSAEASQAATIALIMEQTADAHGQFAREAETVSQRVQVLKAKLGDAAAELGTHLLPYVSAAVGWLSDRLGPAAAAVSAWFESSLVPAIRAAATWTGTHVVPALQALGAIIVGTVIPAIVALIAAIAGMVAATDWQFLADVARVVAPFAAAIGAMVAALMAYHRVVIIVRAVTQAWAIVQGILNAVMMMNPIGLVVLAIIGLIAAIAALWVTNEGFRTFVLDAWEAIKTGISAAVEWVKGAIETLSQVPGKVAAWFEDTKAKAVAKWEELAAAVGAKVDAVRAFIDRLAEIPGKVATWFGQMKDRAVEKALELVAWMAGLPGRIVGALSALGSELGAAATRHFAMFLVGVTVKAGEAVEWVRALPGRIVAALGNLGGLLVGAGVAIMGGLLDGIRRGFEAVKGFVSGIAGWIKEHKGPRSYDLRLLVPAGRWIMQGLSTGLRAELPALRRTLADVSRTITGHDLGVLTPTPTPHAAYGNGGITINVSTLTGGVEAGRAVSAALRDYERARA